MLDLIKTFGLEIISRLHVEMEDYELWSIDDYSFLGEGLFPIERIDVIVDCAYRYAREKDLDALKQGIMQRPSGDKNFSAIKISLCINKWLFSFAVGSPFEQIRPFCETGIFEAEYLPEVFLPIVPMDALRDYAAGISKEYLDLFDYYSQRDADLFPKKRFLRGVPRRTIELIEQLHSKVRSKIDQHGFLHVEELRSEDPEEQGIIKIHWYGTATLWPLLQGFNDIAIDFPYLYFAQEKKPFAERVKKGCWVITSEGRIDGLRSCVELLAGDRVVAFLTEAAADYQISHYRKRTCRLVKCEIDFGDQSIQSHRVGDFVLIKNSSPNAILEFPIVD